MKGIALYLVLVLVLLEYQRHWINHREIFEENRTRIAGVIEMSETSCKIAVEESGKDQGRTLTDSSPWDARGLLVLVVYMR